MAICDIPLADGTCCKQETVWADMCGDCNRAYESQDQYYFDSPENAMEKIQLIFLNHGPVTVERHELLEALINVCWRGDGQGIKSATNQSGVDVTNHARHWINEQFQTRLNKSS